MFASSMGDPGGIRISKARRPRLTSIHRRPRGPHTVRIFSHGACELTLDGQENVLFAARKSIVSDWARNAPLLHLNYRNTRTVMIQNAHGIKSNDNSDPLGNRHVFNGKAWKIKQKCGGHML